MSFSRDLPQGLYCTLSRFPGQKPDASSSSAIVKLS